jgi:hypothetical protein
VDRFIVIFRKSIKWTVLFYVMLCTIYVFGLAIEKWIPLTTVFGSLMILLFFFLAIPAGILEAIMNLAGFQLVHPLRLADMDTVTACIVVYVFNIAFAFVIALLLSFLILVWKHFETKTEVT